MKKIIADYHTHTTFCHGSGTVLDTAKMAKERELVEVAITSHGFNHANSKLTPKTFNKLVEACREAEKETGVKVLVGMEANLINQKGKIDLPKDIEKQCDIVIAGPHQMVSMNLFLFIRMNVCNKLWKTLFKKKMQKIQYTETTTRLIRQDKSKFIKKNTEYVANMLRNNNIDILVHPTRAIMIDAVEIAKVCKETDTYFEINRRSGRFSAEEMKILNETGCKFVFTTDAHSQYTVGTSFNKRRNLDAMDIVVESGISIANWDAPIKLKNHKG